MSGATKTKAATPAPVDEMAEIMNEIEALQKEMASTEAPKPVAAAPKAEPQLKVVPQAPTPVAEEPNALEEFHAAAGGEGSLEETLGDLKDESVSSGNGLLDQVMGAEEQVTEAVAETETVVETDTVAETETVTETETDIVAETDTATEADTVIEDFVEETTQEDEVISMDHKESAQDGTLTMTLTGNMTLKLKYEYDGQEVVVGFSDQHLMVQLADGTEFKVPVNRGSQKLRRVA